MGLFVQQIGTSRGVTDTQWRGQGRSCHHLVMTREEPGYISTGVLIPQACIGQKIGGIFKRDSPFLHFKQFFYVLLVSQSDADRILQSKVPWFAVTLSMSKTVIFFFTITLRSFVLIKQTTLIYKHTSHKRVFEVLEAFFVQSIFCFLIFILCDKSS